MTFEEKGFGEYIKEGVLSFYYIPIIAVIGIAFFHFLNKAVGGFFLFEFLGGFMLLMLLFVSVFFAYNVIRGLWALVPYEVRGYFYKSLIVIALCVSGFNLVT